MLKFGKCAEDIFSLSGEVLFKLHGDELQNEIQLLLYDLVRDNMPQWKQMRVLEVVSAILAETLIEMSVIILDEPVEIHWPNGYVTKPLAPGRGKSGKKTQKSKHGIYGELVAKLAPTLPVETGKENAKPKSKAVSKNFKPPLKSKRSKVTETPAAPLDEDHEQLDSNLHQGLPVQARRGTFYLSICLNLMGMILFKNYLCTFHFFYSLVYRRVV